MSTRDRILARALELFNERGLHVVGVRDLARDLDMSPGNLQYHFSRKDDLVAALVEQMHESNNEVLQSASTGELSFQTLADLTVQLFEHHIRYRALIRSYPDLVVASPALQRLEQSLEAARIERHDRLMHALVAQSLVDPERLHRRGEFVRMQGRILGRFWLSSATVEAPESPPGELARSYARLAVQLLETVATDAGRAEIAAVLQGMEPNE